MTRRDELLRAVSEAATVFTDSPSGARTSFDIIGAVAARNIPLLFRPLDGLWGAFITVNDDERGIIVTTKLGLPVQRFTLAHELGHMLLGHRTSLDKTVGFAGRNAPASRPAHEAAADTFASELLAPKRLLSRPRRAMDGPGPSSITPATSINSRCASASASRRPAGLWSRPASSRPRKPPASRPRPSRI